MGARDNAAPVIIKRKKVVAGGGHHGGAWKVAYADFVTAMMAFFMLMWLLNATTEKQRKGIADYFSPTIPLSRVSGGGDGSFGGESVFSEDQIAQNGTGGSSLKPTVERQAQGQTGTDTTDREEARRAFDEAAKAIESALQGLGGESMAMQRALRHIVTRVTDEGLIIEIADAADEPLFVAGTAEPRPVMRDIVAMLARVLALAVNPVAVNGHLAAEPQVLRDNPAWDLSTARALSVRDALEAAGLARDRAARVTGFGDRKPALRNPAATGNNRIEVILLRIDQKGDVSR
jgi:chemotaxis protein MotB